jgi:hypothetical protein
MPLRRALLALATLTAPLYAQKVSRNNIDAILANPNRTAIGDGAQAPEVDFDQLRQLIEQSRKRPEPTPEEKLIAQLAELSFDRSPPGILATRLEEARASKEPANPKPETESPEQSAARITREAAIFRRDVVLGRWENVRTFLAALPKPVAAKTYEILVAKLTAPTAVNPPPELAAQGATAHTQPGWLPATELLGLAAASPQPPDDKAIQALARLFPKQTKPPASFFDALTKGIPHFGGTNDADRQRAAKFLLETGYIPEAATFLPDLVIAREKKDYAALNLIARHRTELALSDPTAAGKDALPLAWEISTSFLTDEKAPAPARAEALSRALAIIPKLGDDTGRKWLESTFKNPEGAGLELLAALGTLTAQSRENPDESIRKEHLKLQHAAVTTLLATDGFQPAAWSDIFTLFARQWAHEAEVTREKDQSDSGRMVQQFDEWGNLFFSRPNTGYQGPGTRPIGAGELLEIRPDDRWLATLETSARDECKLAATRLFLKVKEEKNALPLIQSIATTDPDQAKSLVRDMIRVWSENHNPNDQQDQRSRYFYFYGFNNQSGTIPLTRSKQERNLVELAELVKGIRALNLGESFDTELAEAFISCHSQAEVWRVEAIESVFGSTEALDSKTLATLVGRMRLNLAGLWPNPKLQQAYQTKRKDTELQQQLLTGYQAAQGMLDRAIAKNPPHRWRIEEQLAALRFEESNYRSSLNPDHRHSSIKREALDALAAAAAAYSRDFPSAKESDESTSVFETWFYAALGSPSLESMKSHHVATPAEFPKIKTALDSLTGDAKSRHLKSFATTLNTRIANVSPDLKLRYLEGAAAIVGDHEAMADASDVLRYYRDLITEIELSTSIDGPDRVGTAAPFGLRINLRHTREIERESGGFQKYLQNQTNSPYGFNFGRPTEDYRDKFEKAARAALEEHFEVLSLTFHSDKVESITDPQFGWRLTPYAYFLLKPKGPQIDRIPPLKIDLDFNDTSGYVVLPITSAEVPIDASKAEPRPFRDLQLTLTLDDRTAKEKGSVFLEIKANARGLIPPLDELIDSDLTDFKTADIEDRTLRVVELDATAEDLAPLSEHEWRIEYQPANGSTLPATFTFPTIKAELAKENGLTRQRYQDVDLIPVGETTPLGRIPTGLNRWLITAIALTAILLATFLTLLAKRRKPQSTGPELLPLPTQLNAVSVIGYLQRLQQSPSLSPSSRAALHQEIEALQARHFSASALPEDPTHLEALARKWQSAA